MKKVIYTAVCMLSVLLFGIGTAKAQFIVRVRPVAPVFIGVRPICPSPRHVWVEGHWRWNRNRGEYIWVEGHWIRERRGYVWINGHWEDVPGQGSRWIPGHWGR
jgi:hypothetical protein